ncbi:MAG: S-adenosylmethionine:tRNA ribosyltransferase-isomerase [Bacteroidetes bacterium]|nr:MAG: S-adenosylmethionine:tRNA ribosyltransferase-isomerase [Bacteroidota bacterium]
MNELPPHLAHLQLRDFYYDLPEDRIARFPLEERDQSNLLKYAGGEISHHRFVHLPEVLPKHSLLILNDTRVIRARLYFRRQTGALIEIFLLHPQQPSEVALAMQARGSCLWSCMIGNKKKWKAGEVLQLETSPEGQKLEVRARLVDPDKQWVELSWTPETMHFAELVEHIGQLPLPPYLNRAATERDVQQYQTVYAREAGAVAAPTAGLHLTPRLLEALKDRGHQLGYVTLHVGAGTFQPVKSQEVARHSMHSEQFTLTRQSLEQLLAHKGPVIPVGTTSMRVLESLYWLGLQMSERVATDKPHFFIGQYDAYRYSGQALPPTREVLQSMLDYLHARGWESLTAETAIFILPGYQFRLCNGLITNYHLPESTLIMLVAAFIGEDWKKVYAEALEKGYRFLSYGDSSLLLP